MRGETSKVKGFWDVMLKREGFVLKEITIESFETGEGYKQFMFWKDCPGKEHLLLVLEYSVLCVYVYTYSHMNTWHESPCRNGL